MSLINAATNAVSTVTNTLSSSGPATALSGIANSLTGKLSSLGSIFKTVPGIKLPLPNPLFNYATYDYVLTLGCLTDKEINNPDSTYLAGKPFKIICKSANADPNNRVNTPYGKFDFFFDHLQMKSQIGLDAASTTNVTNLEFTIREPYSMGMFIISCQTIAQQLGHNNFREAPFILTIEFRGNKETGQMNNIPGTKRFLAFNFSDISMKVSEMGSIYKCIAMPFNQGALADVTANFKSDVSITGDTVRSILQTGENSLQAVVNKKFKEMAQTASNKEAGIVTVPDEIVILFPQDIASNSTPTESKSENNSSATTTPTESDAATIFKKLGVSRSTVNETLVQQAGDCNAIGQAELGFSAARRGDSPSGKDNLVWDPAKKVYVRSENPINLKMSDMKFAQDTDIPNAINQTILSSKFVVETLDVNNLTKEGMRNWWRIDTQVYNIGEVQKATGVKPKLYVYRVVPYEVHASRMIAPNLKAPGFDALKAQAVKHYNYFYTGKNVDVISFDIDINQGFISTMSADGLEKSQDVKTAAQSSADADPIPTGNPVGPGELPSNELGTTPTIVKYIGTNTSSDRKGGGGKETPGQRAARNFMDAVTNSNNLYNLNMKIIGDPYFIVQSGIGNYTAKATQYKNLNLDGTVNYQNGEVDILVNFRTPIDINQTSGMYDFGKNAKSAPVMQFSGLYNVTEVTSTFSNGQFTQVLTGFRRPSQENKTEATPNQTFNTGNQRVDTTNQYGDNLSE